MYTAWYASAIPLSHGTILASWPTMALAVVTRSFFTGSGRRRHTARFIFAGSSTQFEMPTTATSPSVSTSCSTLSGM